MSTSPKIFITGATGFIGSHTAAVALKAGHNVRLSIRRPEQQQRLERVFASHLSQIEFAVVPDITSAEDIRKALVGIDHIWHIASPMPKPGGDIRKHYVEPAVRGTLAVLEAAHTVETIKKVFIMSSVVALKPMGTFGNSDAVTGMYHIPPHPFLFLPFFLSRITSTVSLSSGIN
jgi:nucleoside-diphosphate-sugar epimerase